MNSLTCFYRLILILVTSLTVACTSNESVLTKTLEESAKKAQQSKPLRIATWNLEHFAYPANQGCAPRNMDEIKAMQSYAVAMDADIVALQEVQSVEAAEVLFPQPEWRIIFSSRPHSPAYECRRSNNLSTQQKLAFAVKNTISVASSRSLSEFGLDRPGLRYALNVTINTGGKQIELLNVHLKSGCFVNDYRTKDSEACKVFSRQAPLLKEWIAERLESNKHFIVLGDFNHRLTVKENYLRETLFDNRNMNNSTLVNGTQSLKSCHPRYPDLIDHILTGNISTQAINSPNVYFYENMQESSMLSDHCAISIDINAHRL